MEFTNIPSSDFYANFADSEEPTVRPKHITAARLAKAEIKRKAELTVAKATQAARLRAKHLNREDSAASSSDQDEDDDDDDDNNNNNNNNNDEQDPEHKTPKPKRAPKAKLTAKEKQSAREELAAAKKKRTAERRGRKGGKSRRAGLGAGPGGMR